MIKGNGPMSYFVSVSELLANYTNLLALEPYLYITFGVVLICFVALFIYRIKRNRKIVKDNVHEIGKVRYTNESNAITKEGETNLTYNTGDILLEINKSHTVSKKGLIKPGKYIVLSSNQNEKKFNMRVGKYVREYEHNQEIIVSEGDEVCAVNIPVILR